MHNTQRLALAFLFLLTACGFSPIYGAQDGKGEPVAAALNAVYIDNIGDSNGQALRNKLMDRLYTHGRPQHPTARLSVTLNASELGLGVQKDSTTSRAQYSMSARFKLEDMEGNQLHAGTARALVSYSRLDAQYGTLASQRNAQERALAEVGEQIVNNLSLYYAEKAPYEAPMEKSVKTKVQNP